MQIKQDFEGEKQGAYYMDNWSINMILNPAYRAIADNMRFLDAFKQGRPDVFHPNQGTVMPPQGGDPYAMSASQAMYFQEMMFRMTQMTSVMMQMGGILQTLKEADVDFKKAGLKDDQIAFLDKFFANIKGNISENPEDEDDLNPNGRYQAISYLSQMLKKEAHESNVEDKDQDGNVVSEGDLESLKAAIEDKKFTSSDLTLAFQYLLVKGKTSKQDELMELFSMAEKDGLVKIKDFMKVKFIHSLPSDKQTLLINFITDRGLAESDGKPNARLTSFLINSLSDEADEKLGIFGKNLVKALISKWLKPEIPSSDSDRQQLVHFLSLQGFKFKEDGSLAPDTEQPFPVN